MKRKSFSYFLDGGKNIIYRNRDDKLKGFILKKEVIVMPEYKQALFENFPPFFEIVFEILWRINLVLFSMFDVLII
jgi:hypothetical protein